MLTEGEKRNADWQEAQEAARAIMNPDGSDLAFLANFAYSSISRRRRELERAEAKEARRIAKKEARKLAKLLNKAI